MLATEIILKFHKKLRTTVTSLEYTTNVVKLEMLRIKNLEDIYYGEMFRAKVLNQGSVET
jgi:hypothetical protein